MIVFVNILPFLNNKMSIFEEYGAFKYFVVPEKFYQMYLEPFSPSWKFLPNVLRTIYLFIYF